jgi:hypothetical protein
VVNTVVVDAGPPPPPAGETAKVAALDVPPPGPGLETVTLAVIGDARSVAGIAAVSRVALMKDVARAAPFHRTVELERKLEPSTVKAKPGLPAVALEGESDASEGAGLPPDELPSRLPLSSTARLSGATNAVDACLHE